MSGRLYDADGPALVLSHMGRLGDSQDDWAATAETLAARGFSVLTYNRNGICDQSGESCSEGSDRLESTWLEVLGAVDYLKGQGKRRIFVGGASIGAMASLRAAQEQSGDVAGVIWFAGVLNGSGYDFAAQVVAGLECPKLFISGDADGYGAPTAAQSLFDWSAEPKRLLLVDSSMHGTDILAADSAEARQVQTAIVEFLDEYAETDTVCYENPTPGATLGYQVPGMHLAEVARDFVYTDVDGERRLDVYRPANVAARLPVVLIGGPPQFRAGRSSGQKIGWAQLIASRRLAAAVFDIRSDNFQATPADPSEDVRAAIEFIRTHADELNVDPDRMCTLGFSIGTAPWHLWAAMRDPQPWLKCTVTYYGPLDFESPSFNIDPELVDDYSALTYLRRDGAEIAPMLIAKAGAETNRGINESIDRFATEAERLSAPVTVLTNENGVHGFDASAHDARTAEIIRATLDFLADNI